MMKGKDFCETYMADKEQVGRYIPTDMKSKREDGVVSIGVRIHQIHPPFHSQHLGMCCSVRCSVLQCVLQCVLQSIHQIHPSFTVSTYVCVEHIATHCNTAAH